MRALFSFHAYDCHPERSEGPWFLYSKQKPRSLAALGMIIRTTSSLSLHSASGLTPLNSCNTEGQ
jgi:hypothetical protein